MSASLFWSRLALVALAAGALVLAWLFRQRVTRVVRGFFTAADDPLNLAVFRVILFWTLFHFSNPEQLRWFSELPESLRIMPWGSRWWLLDRIPINAVWVTAAYVGLRAAALAAMVGLFTRTSAAVAAILAVYVLGVPQFFGKVNHYHHLVWFAAILAASRCGDALSLDALGAAWRRASRGLTEPPQPSRAYALPLRFVWLLFGLLYFFPGFWKWWANGIDWVWSDNLSYWMYSVWVEHPGWRPFWRIDQYPVICHFVAMATIVFEMGFIWCVFLPKARAVMALGGLAFHKATDLFMRIRFASLLPCYVAFVNWSWLLRWAGARLFHDPLLVLYDGNCRLCRRTIALIRTVDWFRRITYVNALDEAALARVHPAVLDQQALLKDMHALCGPRRWVGYDAYRAIAWRVPLLWPVAPLLYLPPVATLGRRIYRHVADGRTCEVPTAGRYSAVARSSDAPVIGTRAVIVVAAFLMLGNAYYGIRGLSSSWPLACYPTFSKMLKPITLALETAVLDAEGREQVLDDSRLRRSASVVRWRNLLGSILSVQDERERRRQLAALWRLRLQHDPSLAQVRVVRFYKITRSILPERAGDPPLHRELLWEMSTVL